MAAQIVRKPTVGEMIDQLEQHHISCLELEREAQRQRTCPCCGADKRLGLLVCEQCWNVETPTGLVPLKFAGMTYAVWIKQAREEQAGRGLRVIEGGAS